ncbi:MAG TPA: hypothetical protein VM266_08235 [Solirubrobacteraceae bacterium]|nr:hypothetical protein [Solirubrobacteraceae bacterium]
MERARWTRLRWRLRGAWQWPTFAACTAGEAVLLDALPIWGNGPGGLVPALLLAGFMNLAVVALAAPLAGRLLRRRRPDLPRPIAVDYAGTALLGLLALALVTAGVANHSRVRREREARAQQATAVAHYVAAQAADYRGRLREADTLRLEADVYRTCVPGPDPKRWLCLFVETDQEPPGVTRDPDSTPNSAYRRGGFP